MTYVDGTRRELNAIPPHESWDSAMDHAQFATMRSKGVDKIEVIETHVIETITRRETVFKT